MAAGVELELAWSAHEHCRIELDEKHWTLPKRCRAGLWTSNDDCHTRGRSQTFNRRIARCRRLVDWKRTFYRRRYAFRDAAMRPALGWHRHPRQGATPKHGAKQTRPRHQNVVDMLSIKWVLDR